MKQAIKRSTKSIFLSLKNRNFRLYFFGQAFSLCGTWMQTIGQAWLVLQMTNSGTQLGLVAAAQFLPSFHGTHGHTVVRMLRTLIATFGSIKRSGLADQDEKIAEVLLGLETVGPCVLARY